MESNGYRVTLSFAKFGNMNPNEKPSESNKGMIKKMLESEGFDGVVLTVLKDLKEETCLQKESGYYAGGNYYGYYPIYYGGFYGYYRHPMSMTTSRSKVYVLETTVYDLKAPENKQLIAIVTSKIEDPESASAAAKSYVSKVSASLK